MFGRKSIEQQLEEHPGELLVQGSSYEVIRGAETPEEVESLRAAIKNSIGEYFDDFRAERAKTYQVTADSKSMHEVQPVTIPGGEEHYVVGTHTAVTGTAKVLQKFGFDRFRRLH
jgi:hypothetical protein